MSTHHLCKVRCGGTGCWAPLVVTMDKWAKEMGEFRISDKRKLDPEPMRPTPKKTKKTKPFKAYGFTYECKNYFWRRKSIDWARVVSRSWYETVEQRDQAMKADARPFFGTQFHRNHQPVTRVRGEKFKLTNASN